MMDDNYWRHAAIENNMDWYTAQAHSRHLPFHRDSINWWTDVAVPPLHANLVACGAQPDELIKHIDHALNQAQPGATWSIKDAHANYSLTSAGFSVLFEASWLARPPLREAGPIDIEHAQVQKVTNSIDLQRWVDAWDETPPGTEVFVPALINDKQLQFLYVEQHGQISGGLAINHSKDVIGVSNWFGAPAHIHSCLSYAANTFKEAGVVGYEQDPQQLQMFVELGFKVVGDLQVWIN